MGTEGGFRGVLKGCFKSFFGILQNDRGDAF